MIYLASRSPRRGELLQQIGVNFTVVASDIDETVRSDELPEAYVRRLAHEKAVAGMADMQAKQLTPRPVLAADTTVCIDNLILGKPESDVDAHAMLARMSGRRHRVLTAIALGDGDRIKVVLSDNWVHMAPLSSAEIAAYVASGEPRDKAGAYGIQGLAGAFVRRIEGSYTGIMGLPLHETAALLKEFKISILG